MNKLEHISKQMSDKYPTLFKEFGDFRVEQ